MSRRELGDDLGRHDGRGDRQAVAHRLADRHEVGHERRGLGAVTLEAPHRVAGAAEARLHLVGEVDAAGARRPPRRTGARNPAGSAKHAVGGEDRVGDERCEPHAVRGEVVDRPLHLRGEPLPERRVARPVDAVGSGAGTHAHPVRQRVDADERRRDRRDLGRDPVVGVARHDHARAARVLLGDPQREVVRLRPGAGEHHVAELVGQRGEQVLGVPHDRPRAGSGCAC